VKKKKVVKWSFVVLLLIFITPNVIAFSTVIKNEEEIDDLEPYGNIYDQNGDIIASTIKENVNYKKAYVKFYDENDYLINSYSQKQVKERFVGTDIHKKSTEGKSGEPYANFYDENGILVNEQVDMSKEIVKLAGYGENVFVFRYSSFLENIVIGKNRTFYKPKSIIIEPDVKFESMTINIINSVGKRAVKIETGNFVEALNIDLEDYIEDDFYSIIFTNENKNKRIQLVGGVVIYN